MKTIAIKPDTVDAYLAQVPAHFAEALEVLRALIRQTVPDAEEGIGYGIPTYKWRGPLVSFGAAAKHCAFYGMSPKVLASFADELKGFSTSPGTVRFTPEKPIPEALVVAIIKARMAENVDIEAARKAKRKSK